MKNRTSGPFKKNRKKKKNQINNMRNERRNLITDPTDFKREIRKSY